MAGTGRMPGLDRCRDGFAAARSPDWPVDVLAGAADLREARRDRAAGLVRRRVVMPGLPRLATRPQADGNGGGFCSFCAADRRPPGAKEHSHEEATKSSDKGGSGGPALLAAASPLAAQARHRWPMRV